jgi:lipopolysaccharide/colanic/teichoic acid biosynthesis glycosyltransferase
MIDEVVDTLEPHDRTVRAMVKPGLTGPWQVSTMGMVALHDHPELDNAYVRKASFMTDARIILITAASMIGRSAIEPDDLTRRLRW